MPNLQASSASVTIGRRCRSGRVPGCATSPWSRTRMTSNVVQGSTRLILIGAALLLSVGMGLRQSLGLFLTPLTRDLGLTAADFTLTIAIQNIVWGMSQAPVG